ncbi:MAG: methyltransferase domain-containing protein [Sulfurovum sp.]|nr:methyltransferase domain-containing protein [Sulfurovum sp.]
MEKQDIYYKGFRTEIIPFLPKKYSKVLEVGCGEGGFRNNLTTQCEYWGIEPVEEILDIARGKLDKALLGTYAEVVNELPNDYFDLIICNDVIEHMQDHIFFYETIQRKVKTHAYMVGAIPNVRYLPNLYHLLRDKDWEYQEEGILDKTHLRFFTLNSIKRDFLNNGFSIEKLYGINKVYFSKKTLNGLKMLFLQFLLGKDTKFLQFGFRVKLK